MVRTAGTVSQSVLNTIRVAALFVFQGDVSRHEIQDDSNDFQKIVERY